MVMSIGWNPFYKNVKKTIEPHLLHTFGNDFYGQELRLVITGFMRNEQNYPSLDALITAIHTDIATAGALLGTPEYQKHAEDTFLFSESTTTTSDVRKETSTQDPSSSSGAGASATATTTTTAT